MNYENNFINGFENLPSRIFLDSSILQNIHTYGEFIWDNVEMDISEQIKGNIESLKSIMMVMIRANFEFALSNNSIREIQEKNDSHYLQWAYEVLDYWINCIKAYRESKSFTGKGENILRQLNEKEFGYLSRKDKALMFDTIALECQVFLTMDIRLWKNKKHLESKINIKILQPYEYWELLRPYASLWV